MKHLKKRLVVVMAAALLSGLLTLPLYAQVTSAPGEAQNDPGQKAGNEWQFTLIPYAWLAGISGDITVKNRTEHMSVPFDDILQNLDFGGQVQVEARKDNWGMFFQANYMKLTPNASLSRPAAVDLMQGGPTVRQAEIRTDTQVLITEFGGFYRLGQVDYSLNGQKSASFDVLAGGRYWYLQSYTFLNLPQRGYSFSNTLYGDVIDPMIGLRMQTYFARNFFVNLRGDAAGFGVSSNSSHISWNGVGGIGYDLSPHSTLLAGYRYLYIDYSPSGGCNIKLTMQGPVIGFAYKF